MGLRAGERAALEAGLDRMRIIKDMPACVSGATFDWPQVVFKSPDEAGDAVAVALQEATCTFTVAATPQPTPTPAAALGAVPGIRVTAGDGRIELTWGPTAAAAVPILDYKARCGPGDERLGRIEGRRVARAEGRRRWAHERTDLSLRGRRRRALGRRPVDARLRGGHPDRAAGGPGDPSVEALDRAVKVSVDSRGPCGRVRVPLRMLRRQRRHVARRGRRVDGRPAVRADPRPHEWRRVRLPRVCRWMRHSPSQAQPAPISRPPVFAGAGRQRTLPGTPVLAAVLGDIGAVLLGVTLMTFFFIAMSPPGWKRPAHPSSEHPSAPTTMLTDPLKRGMGELTWLLLQPE